MSKKPNSDFSMGTRITQVGRDPAKQAGFVNAPVYRGSTVIFPTVSDIEHNRAEFNYGTMGTPTIANLENAWSELAGAAGTVLSPSGLGAIALALLTTLKAGDHLLMPDSVYKPTRLFCAGMLGKMGIETTYYDPLIGADIKTLFRPNTSTLFLESPGSQSFEIQDIPTMTALAKRQGIATIIDNTWATPIFFRAHEHGCDLSVEAGTKYLGGHSDLLMGVVSANEDWWPKLRETYDLMAMLPGAEDCFLALRGLRTMYLRLKEAEKRGLEMAHWLKSRPEVLKVLHPALPDCPGHEFWQRDFKGSSGLFSLILQPEYTKAGVDNMLDNMSIFAMGYSWGGFESLVIPFNCAEYRTVTQWQPGGRALRLQIGLEDMDELKADLAQGFERLKQAV
ncbi:cystathionine beta-lyase [Yersinia massiliensis]|jgi:cystathionine beta-lyase|uniref:Cystathionine beta-lyase n=2 Tax=Yersinia TaxID=629 RepID=A0A2R4NLC6_9GAMM|nr:MULTISPECIES: cystathionine beta-lyase [Yersinia]HEC1651223.1 cystathionine beta-lyase [Yersinia enterocolitica]ATM87289.1 cystathionine beta-lyase [Yersinia frederiksenii]AVX36906.1 cystathionine beta-lyase [Yersinia massiliensis]MCB5317900.1 cystathionine beta-lyase [Yersinia massiliensis]MDA5548973.1 cystathionine beta-lyase [Yersinia massiliensis]